MAQFEGVDDEYTDLHDDSDPRIDRRNTNHPERVAIYDFRTTKCSGRCHYCGRVIPERSKCYWGMSHTGQAVVCAQCGEMPRGR